MYSVGQLLMCECGECVRGRGGLHGELSHSSALILFSAFLPPLSNCKKVVGEWAGVSIVID